MSTVSRARKHSVAEHPADRLGEARGGVLRSSGWDRESRNPRPAPRRTAREADTGGDRGRERGRRRTIEDKEQQPIVGAARRGDRHDQTSQAAGSLWAGSCRRSALHHRRQRVDHQHPAHAGQDAEGGEAHHGRLRQASTSCAAGRSRLRGRPRKADAETPTKQAAARRRPRPASRRPPGTAICSPHAAGRARL